MRPDTAAWIATMRAWAAEPGAVIFPIRTKTANVAIFPEDVTARTDEQLLKYIAARLAGLACSTQAPECAIQSSNPFQDKT